jgi:hypothetical protein
VGKTEKWEMKRKSPRTVKRRAGVRMARSHAGWKMGEGGHEGGSLR